MTKKGPLKHTASDWLSQDPSFASRTLYDEITKQDGLLRHVRDAMDSNTLRMAREAAQTVFAIEKEYEKAVAPARAMLQQFDEQTKTKTALFESLRQSWGLGPGGALEEYQKQLAEVTKPLLGLGTSLQQQQNQLAGIVSSISVEQWREFDRSADVFREYFGSNVRGLSLGIEAARAAVSAISSLEQLEPDEPDNSIVLALVALLVAIVQGLAKNTGKEARNIGLITVFMILSALKTLWPDYSLADRERDTHILQIVENIERQANEAAIAQAAEEAYIAKLPRAETIGRARIRSGPSRSASIEASLAPGSAVAVADRRGHWLSIVYRDELTDTVKQGWVFSTSLKRIG